MHSPIVRFVSQSRGSHTDCAVAALGMVLNLSYSEALVLLARFAPKVLTAGATDPQIMRAAKAHGVQLVLRSSNELKLEEDSEQEGILGVMFPDGDHHAVYFKQGLVFDGKTETVWDVDVYLSAHEAVAVNMLVRKAGRK